MRLRRLRLTVLGPLLTLALSGCSMQQLYGGGRAWQRGECQKINDRDERNRCLARADMPHDEYQRQADEAKAGKSGIADR
jgi:hypothetical protein